MSKLYILVLVGIVSFNTFAGCISSFNKGIEHNEKGAFGLTVNRASGFSVKDVMPEEFHEDYNNFPVHLGGPVQKQSLFYLYSLLPDTEKDTETPSDLIVCPGVYLGGDYKILKQANKYFELQ